MKRRMVMSMKTTFSKDELIPARAFRTLSQRELAQKLRTHEKLGILFAQEGLDAVIVSYERYAALVERLAQLEETLDDAELAAAFGARAETAPDAWIAHPEGVSTETLYRQRRPDSR
jgi:hypothetical protein